MASLRHSWHEIVSGPSEEALRAARTSKEPIKLLFQIRQRSRIVNLKVGTLVHCHAEVLPGHYRLVFTADSTGYRVEALYHAHEGQGALCVYQSDPTSSAS